MPERVAMRMRKVGSRFLNSMAEGVVLLVIALVRRVEVLGGKVVVPEMGDEAKW
jgi:hypothetical protein